MWRTAQAQRHRPEAAHLGSCLLRPRPLSARASIRAGSMRAAVRGPASSCGAPALRCGPTRGRLACFAPRPRPSVRLPFSAVAPAAAARSPALRTSFFAAARAASSPPVEVPACVADDATSRVPPARPPGPAELDADEAKWLFSTRAQRQTFATWAALEVALLCKAAAAPGALAAASASPALAAAQGLALVAAAWLAADLVVGVFHWSVDNYGSGATPVIGHVIDAFQSHHERPWLITRGQFCTVVEGPCVTQMPLQAAALLLASSPGALLFWAAFAAMTVTAQLAHAWSHANRAALPPLVRALQDAGVLISTKVSVECEPNLPVFTHASARRSTGRTTRRPSTTTTAF